MFVNLSSNAAGFSADRPQGENKAGCPYSPFSVYSILEHDGDYAAAASKLNEEGFGDPLPENDTFLTKKEKRQKAHAKFKGLDLHPRSPPPYAHTNRRRRGDNHHRSQRPKPRDPYSAAMVYAYPRGGRED